MNDEDNSILPFPTSTAPALTYGLEHPALAPLSGNDGEQKDTLGFSGAFSLSPFYYATPDDHLEGLQREQPPANNATLELNNKHLATLRKSRAAKLLATSTLSLKAWQMDMDCPPGVHAYVEEQLTRLLFEQTGKPFLPDQLYMDFTTDTRPAVFVDGQELYTRRLSLTDVAVTSFDAAGFYGLMQSAEPERPFDEGTPSLTTTRVLALIDKADWPRHYETLLTAFWARHETTYRTLAKLSFLDTLGRYHTRKIISLDGYNLALEAMGLDRFPTTVEALETSARGERTVVRVVLLNGNIVPGIFQLTSKNTSHSFIHIIGQRPAVFEYIGDDPELMRQKLLNALNTSPCLAPYLDVADERGDAPFTLDIKTLDEDIFSALTRAQKAFSLEQHAQHTHVDTLFMWVERGLTLVSALDRWELQPDIVKRIPNPLKAANRLMRGYLKNDHQLDMNPDHVFIRYIRGTSTTPLGSAHSPITYVHTPDETPISLSKALLSNYRVERPVGYIDNGGRTKVYTAPTGKGQGSEETELTISPEVIENHIRSINFLDLMSKQLNRFWEEQGTAIEQSFKATFMAQAVISLKQKQLTRAGFDLIVEMLDTTSTSIRCKALGFYLKPSLIKGTQCQCCAGLLVFTHADTPLAVLYQAGQAVAFIEFNSDIELTRYIQTAAKDKQWQRMLLSYIPVRLHENFMYILDIWSGNKIPDPTSSLLRPWTDVIYANDLHKAKARALCEQPITSSPFVFMREMLQRNHQDDANEHIVTSKEVSLRYWTRQLNHLQLLLAPMSLLLVPAALISLATHAGSIYLGIATAALPGNRDTEKTQAVLNALSLGLLQLAPYTPRLLRLFNTFNVPGKTAIAVASATPAATKSFGSWLSRSMNARKTRLETFFNTNSLLKTWTLPGHSTFGTLPVKAWKLDRKFMLWTSDTAQARTLVVSTHGYYLPWTKTARIPNGTELRTYAPHGYELIDPRLHRVVSQRVKPFSILNNANNSLALPPGPLPPYAITDKVLAGTSLPGSIKNYSLMKFQSTHGETYQEISQVVRHSNLSPLNGLPATPMDVLTVRNRFGMAHPNLQDLFKSLSEQGIHYDKILLVHCRCAAINSLMGRSPTYIAPAASLPITP
jgi:hypothetical protein